MRTCPDCGATLDPNEVCDCTKKEGAPAATGTPSGGNDGDRHSAISVPSPFGEVNTLLRLKPIRESTGAMAKDVALVVQNRFPKFTRQLLAQAEAYEKYGVLIHPEGMKAICDHYGISLDPVEISVSTPSKPRKKPNRKLGRKLTFRMTDKDFEALQQRVQSDGFDSVQAWLYAAVTKMLGGATNGSP